MMKTIIRFISFIMICIIIGGFSSCKSHKKMQEETPVTEHTIKHKDKKGKSLGEKIAEEALTWIGTPYAYGKQGKGSGTDCSGLTMTVYLEVAEIKIPRNSAKQAEFCKDLKAEEVKAGDLVFFATGKSADKVSHVGVMIDANKFVHASSSKGVVVSDMGQSYYKRTFVKFGRVPSM